MPIDPAEIHFKMSGGALNSDPAASLGGAISSTGVPDDTLHALFPEFSGGQAEGGYVRYRCIYIKNSDGALTLSDAEIWVESETTSPNTTVRLAVGASAVNGTETAISDETVPPDDVNFFAANGQSEALALGSLPPGEHRAVWVEWTTDAGSESYNADTVILKVEGDDGT